MTGRRRSRRRSRRPEPRSRTGGRTSRRDRLYLPAPFDPAVDVDDAFAGVVLAPGVVYEEGLEHFLAFDGDRAFACDSPSDSCSGAVVEAAHRLAVYGGEPGAEVVGV